MSTVCKPHMQPQGTEATIYSKRPMDCRLEERDLLGAIRRVLTSLEDSPEVEVSAEELRLDPLMSALVEGQRQRSTSSREQGGRCSPDQPSAEGGCSPDQLGANQGLCDNSAPASTPAPCPSVASALLLDLAASCLLLKLHPDRGVQRQVYDVAVHPRCLAALDGLDQLAAVRR